MPAGFSDDAARVAFREAIHAVEGASSAEVVVAVRRQSASWAEAHWACGAGAAAGALGFMLFADHPFSTWSLFLDPIVVGVLIGLASTLVLGVKRWLTPASARRRAVLGAARASFVERGIRRTTGATGVLVYISVAEAMAEVIADDGVVAALPGGGDADWKRAVAAIDAAVGKGGVATARAIAVLAPLLGKALPRGAEDVNELPDDLHVGDHH